MLARIRRSVEEKDSGFTLIELLVVMIIIGILAAIAIPAFLSQRAKARDTATKADVSTIGKELSSYYVDGADGTPVLTVNTTTKKATLKVGSTVVSNDLKVSDGTTAPTPASKAASGTSGSDWCLSLTNPAGSTASWNYKAAGGLTAGTC